MVYVKLIKVVFYATKTVRWFLRKNINKISKICFLFCIFKKKDMFINNI